MYLKKLWALLLAVALAVSVLLAGCGGGGQNQSLAQVILNLLDGQYPNVTVQLDSELEADLRQALAESETEGEVISALERILGVTISFSRLGDGQKGDHGFDLILYPGTDPDAAGRSAFAAWNKVFGSLPSSGQYTAKLAMIETEDGYAILVHAAVTKAADREDPDPRVPYSVTMSDSGTVTDVAVGTSDGLSHILFGGMSAGDAEEEAALKEARDSGFKGVTITLEGGATYTVSQRFAENDGVFMGTLKGESGASISLTSGGSLFDVIGSSTDKDNGKVENITFYLGSDLTQAYEYTVTTTSAITGNTTTTTQYFIGTVTGINYGTISSCHVYLNGRAITAANKENTTMAGGLVGRNDGAISNCTVTGGAITASTGSGVGGEAAKAGGIAGHSNSTISGCTVTGARIQAISSGGDVYAGGVVGYLYNNEYNTNGEITSCKVTGDTDVSVEVPSENVDINSSPVIAAGGVVGRTDGPCEIQDVQYTGSGAITASANQSYVVRAGGLVGELSYRLSGSSYTGSGAIRATSGANGNAYAGGLVGRQSFVYDGVSEVSGSSYTGSGVIEAGVQGSNNDSEYSEARAGGLVGMTQSINNEELRPIIDESSSYTGSGSIRAEVWGVAMAQDRASAGGLVGRRQRQGNGYSADVNGSYNGSSTITAKVAEGTASLANNLETNTAGKASVGTKIGYDESLTPPGPLGRTTQTPDPEP